MAKKQKARDMIRGSAEILKDLFRENLADLGDAIISQVMIANRKGKTVKAINGITWPGENAYRAEVKQALAQMALISIMNVRKEIPKAKSVKLMERIDAIKLDEYDGTTAFDELPTALQEKIKKRAQLLVDTQLADLEKSVSFQYLDSHDTTEDPNVLEKDLNDAAMEYISGQAIEAGANLIAAQTVNEARSAFFFDSDVLDEVDAFQFVNGDPVTPICQDLAGTIFAKDDPEMFRYTPPLHWNCKSSIEPILKGDLGDREIEPLRPSTSKLEDSIQFHEHVTCLENCSH